MAGFTVKVGNVHTRKRAVLATGLPAREALRLAAKQVKGRAPKWTQATIVSSGGTAAALCTPRFGTRTKGVANCALTPTFKTQVKGNALAGARRKGRRGLGGDDDTTSYSVATPRGAMIWGGVATEATARASAQRGADRGGKPVVLHMGGKKITFKPKGK